MSPFSAFNITPISGILFAPAPNVINPPAAPDKKLLFARVPILSPVKPVAELAAIFPELAENWRPNFWAESSDISAIIASTYTWRGALSINAITDNAWLTELGVPESTT